MKKSTLILLILVISVFNSCEKSNSSNPSNPENNLKPVITSLEATPKTISSEENSSIVCIATDPEKQALTYSWYATGGSFSNTNSSSVIWTAPNVQSETNFKITVLVNDDKHSITEDVYITVTPKEPETIIVTLEPKDDAYVVDKSPDSNYGDDQALLIGKTDFGGGGIYNYFTYIKFDISSIPTNAIITTAEFRPIVGYNSSAVKPVGDIYLFGVPNTNWNEETITFNNCPERSDYVIVIERDVTFDIASKRHIDIKWHLKEYLGTNNFYSFMIYGNFGATSRGYFYSKEVSGYEPELYIEYILE